ncbi:hypothetical protein V3564_04410 [Bartonella sp. B12(2025)]
MAVAKKYKFMGAEHCLSFCCDRLGYCQMVYHMCVLRCFENIKKRDFGNAIEHEGTLCYKCDWWVEYNTSGKCFIEDGCVFTDAMVYSDVRICNNTYVHDIAQILQIHCMLPVSSIARVYGNAQVYNYVEIFENSQIYVNALVRGYTEIRGKAFVKLIVSLTLFEIICVLAFYINKYGANNWRDHRFWQLS